MLVFWCLLSSNFGGRKDPLGPQPLLFRSRFPVRIAGLSDKDRDRPRKMYRYLSAEMGERFFAKRKPVRE